MVQAPLFKLFFKKALRRSKSHNLLRMAANSLSGAPTPSSQAFAFVEDLVLEHLRANRADISEIKLKVDELAGSYIGLLKIAAFSR